MLGAACPQVVGQVQQLLVGPLRGVQLGLLALLLALLLTATPVNQSWIKNRSILIPTQRKRPRKLCPKKIIRKKLTMYRVPVVPISIADPDPKRHAQDFGGGG